MSFKQKVVYDAGVTSTVDIYEINDQTGRLSSVPKSSYAITETLNFAFTYNRRILAETGQNLDIADGQRRPGTAGK